MDPPLEKGDILEDCAPQTTDANKIAGFKAGFAAHIAATTGNREGATTLRVELKKLITPAINAIPIGSQKTGIFVPIH